MATAWLLFVV